MANVAGWQVRGREADCPNSCRRTTARGGERRPSVRSNASARLFREHARKELRHQPTRQREHRTHPEKEPRDALAAGLEHALAHVLGSKIDRDARADRILRGDRDGPVVVAGAVFAVGDALAFEPAPVHLIAVADRRMVGRRRARTAAFRAHARRQDFARRLGPFQALIGLDRLIDADPDAQCADREDDPRKHANPEKALRRCHLAPRKPIGVLILASARRRAGGAGRVVDDGSGITGS